MYRFAPALAALAFTFTLASSAAEPEKMAGTWVANLDAKTKDYLTIKSEDGTWTVTGVYKVGDKEIGSYKGENVGLVQDSLKFKKVHVQKPFPSAKDGELFTASAEKNSVALTRGVGKKKATTHYASADAAKPEPKVTPKVDPKADPKVEAKGERYPKPDAITAKPGDTVRLLLVKCDKGITDKHAEALKKGAITKMEGGFGGFEEEEQRLVVSDVSDQPKELELVTGTYRMVVISDRSPRPMSGFIGFCSVKLPVQCNFTDLKLVGEAKGKFKVRTAAATEGTIYVVEAKVLKWSK